MVRCSISGASVLFSLPSESDHRIDSVYFSVDIEFAFRQLNGVQTVLIGG